MAVAWALSPLCSPQGNLLYLRLYSPNDGILIQCSQAVLFPALSLLRERSERDKLWKPFLFES